MAKQGQKFNTYTKEFRNKMIEELQTKTANEISKEFNINVSTLKSWKASFKKQKLNTKKGPKKGEVKDLEYYKVRYEFLKKLQDFHKQNNTK